MPDSSKFSSVASERFSSVLLALPPAKDCAPALAMLLSRSANVLRRGRVYSTSKCLRKSSSSIQQADTRCTSTHIPVHELDEEILTLPAQLAERLLLWAQVQYQFAVCEPSLGRRRAQVNHVIGVAIALACCRDNSGRDNFSWRWRERVGIWGCCVRVERTLSQ